MPQYLDKLILILLAWYKTKSLLAKHCIDLDQGKVYVVLFFWLFQAKAGFILNFLGVITINIAINTWGVAMFQLNTFPSWANVTNTP